MMINQPYYMLDFSASACMFDIRINDYPVLILNVEGQVSTMLPINNAILESGEQNISARVMPVLGQHELDPNAELKFDIKLFDVANDFVFQKQFNEYKSEPVNEKKIPALNYESVFWVDVPYKQDAWQNGQKLTDNKKMRSELEIAYNQISDLIKSKNYDKFRQLLANREQNIAKSMYLSENEANARIDDLIEDFENGFNVMPLPNDAVMHIYAYGKVAALKKLNGESALYLYSKKTQENLMLDISFYIPKGKNTFEVI